MAGPTALTPPKPRCPRRRMMGRLAAWAAAGLAACRIGGPGVFTPSASSSAKPEPSGFVGAPFSSSSTPPGLAAESEGGKGGHTALHAIIQRPVGGPKPKQRLHYLARPHYPDGSRRLPGPVRALYLNKTITATLQSAIAPWGRGGLRGRYANEVELHLADMAALRARGEQIPAHVFWDIENIGVFKVYEPTIPPRKFMHRILSWFSGVVDAPVTRVEAVEFTRDDRTPQEHYNMGVLSWHTTIRMMGGIVHRAWPRMTDFADRVLLDRLRDAVDDMESGGPKRMIVLLSTDKGFIPMLEYAQSKGVTVVRFTSMGEGNYYPGGCNFSVPINVPEWITVRKELLNRKLDPLRPEEEFTKEQGPRKWQPGFVGLQPAPEEELDRRIFHSWSMPPALEKAAFDGSWRRAGLRLNDTLVAKLERALERTGKGELQPEAREAVEKQLPVLRDSLDKGVANIYWNLESMILDAQGPPMPEMLARVVRWLGGVVNMPINRVEVSRFVEPWEKFGSFAHDWLYHMDKLGMIIHRVWPPRSEMTNLVLTGSISSQAKVITRAASPEEAFDAGKQAFDARENSAIAQAAAEGTADGRPQGTDRPLLVKVSVEVSADKTDTILVREGDLPEALAEEFIAGQDLPSDLIQPLTDHISENVKQALATKEKKAAEEEAKVGDTPRSPRLICILSDDVPFDEGMRQAQRAGINVVWFGPENEGLFYAANSDVRVRIDVLPWKTAMKEVSQAVRNPFSGGSTPDAPAPIWARWDDIGWEAEEVDTRWGKQATLALDRAPLQLTEEEQLSEAVAR